MEMISIEKFVPGGMAIGTRDDGMKMFFWNALPGESVVEYKITKKKAHYIEAIATKVLNENEHRVKPKDECFLSTSPWQILDFEFELSQKAELVREMFREQGISIEVPEIFTDYHDYFYRNKMEYALYWDNESEKIELALHERGSHRKIPISQSSIERPEILQAAKKIVLELNESHEEARKYQSLIMRASQDKNVSGGLYVNNMAHERFLNLQDTILGREYSYSPNGFFQINLPVYEEALREIRKNISETPKILDLYSGVGTIGLSVANEGQELTLVECDKAAYAEMEENAKRNFQGLARTVLAKSEEVLDFISPDECVILDPPRAGCDKKLISRLIEKTPTEIIYLSCNPMTQARDVAELLGKYIIYDIKTYNFFPHTPHIENLVVLKRK